MSKVCQSCVSIHTSLTKGAIEMKTFKRICLKDHILRKGHDALRLKRGEEYITSRTIDGHVIVYSKYWTKVPVSVFGGEVKFTS